MEGRYGRKKRRNRKMFLAGISCVILLILAVCVFYRAGDDINVFIDITQKKETDVSSEKQKKKEQIADYADDIYQEHKSINDYHEEVSENFSNRIKEKECSEKEKLIYEIVELMESGTDSEVENCLNYDALSEKGYALNFDGITDIRKSYLVDDKVYISYRIMPCENFSFSDYMYCMIKIVPIKKDGTADYIQMKNATYTVYSDGTFLPFAIDHLSVSTPGVHKKTH